MSRKYTDFELWVYPDTSPGAFRVQAAVAGRVEEGRISSPITEADLEAFRGAVANGRSRDARVREKTRVSARKLGTRLFDEVFNGRVRDLLMKRLPGFASRRANELGLRGMIGNAWELVDEWYQEPPGKESTGELKKPRRVRRGGGFDSAPENCRATARSSQDPSRRANDVGFRLVREIEPLGR